MRLIHDILIFLGILAVIILILSALGGLMIILPKAIGILMILAGIFLVIWFPDIPKYQPIGMSKAGVLIGIIAVIIGVVLVLV